MKRKIKVANDENKKCLTPSPFEKRAYVKVPDQKRFQFIQLLLERKITIKEAASELGIHYSTAKCIAKIYRQEKRIMALSKGVKTAKIAIGKRLIARKEAAVNRHNESSTLIKTPELLSENLKAANKERGIEFDFSVYTAKIDERYVVL